MAVKLKNLILSKRGTANKTNKFVITYSNGGPRFHYCFQIVIINANDIYDTITFVLNEKND